MLKPEIEARVILPAVRAMIAKKLIKNYHFTQAKTARLLGITQATVSNYYREKRGVMKGSELEEIREKADEAARLLAMKPDRLTVLKCLMDILKYVEEKRIVCQIHRKLELWLEGMDCDVCFA